MVWSSTLSLTVTIGGSAYQTSLLSASFGGGRQDWFDTLSPNSASFTFEGDKSGTISVGQSVVIACSGTLWTGVVDTVSVDADLGPSHYTTSVSAIDTLGQVGQARLEDESIGAATSVVNNIKDMFAAAGVTVTTTTMRGSIDFALYDVSTASGSLLDFIAEAEVEANIGVGVRPDGKVVIVQRGSWSDYGYRVYEGYLSTVSTAPDSHWRMEEASGTLSDESGGVSFTASGTPTYHQTDPWNRSKAIGFQKADAADQFAASPADSYDLTGANWTIMGWLYWDGTTSSDSYILDKLAAGPNGWLLMVTTGSKLNFQSFNAGSTTTNVSSTNNITANTWTHFCVSSSGGNTRIIINGDSASTASGSKGTIPNTAGTLRMGSGGAANWFGGRLCNISIWSSVALTAAQAYTLAFLDYVDLSGSLTPFAYTTTSSQTTVINHWIFRSSAGTVDASYTDATSIASYGDHTFEAQAQYVSTSIDSSWSSTNRAALKNPRTISSVQCHITSSTMQSLVSLAPLSFVNYGGSTFQVMGVQHDITPDTWDVTLNLSGTVADLTTGEAELPV